MAVSPRRRWYDTPEGASSAARLDAVLREVAEALAAGDVPRGCALLSGWEARVDTTPLSLKALHSIRAALADAHDALSSGRTEDSRAFVQAAASMLP